MNRKIRNKSAARYYYNTRNSRRANFDSNRGEEIESELLKTPEKIRNKSGKKSSNVYPLTSRPLSQSDEAERMANSNNNDKEPSGFMRTTSEHSFPGFHVAEQEHYHRRSTGALPKTPSATASVANTQVDIRREIDQSVRTAVEQVQFHLMNQLQESVNQAITVGFQRLSLSNENITRQQNVSQNIQQGNENSRELPGINRNINGAGDSQPNFSFDSQGNRKVRLEDWGFTYEGKMDGSEMTVEDFLFRVEIMREASEYSNGDVFKFFSKITRGRAQSFYWQFRNINRESNWEEFEAHFKEQFKFRESDLEIDAKMYSRKQGYNENFNDFHGAIMALNMSRTVPKSNADIISLLRTNCRFDISSKMLTFTTDSLSEMVKQCRSIEQFLNNHKPKNFQNKPFVKRVNEIQHEEDVSDELDKCQGSEEEVSEIVCSNCDHKVICCYRCHAPGVTFKNCKKCQGNIRSTEMNRNFRSQ